MTNEAKQEERDRCRKEIDDAFDELRREVISVLSIMDGLAGFGVFSSDGDEGSFRRCRDRLRKAVDQ
jgi:hypothetical protein